MSENTEPKQPKEKVGKRLERLALVGLGVILAAALAEIGTGLGSSAIDRLTPSDDEPVSASSEELGFSCGLTVFLPRQRAQAALRAGPPEDWDEFQRQPGAAFARTHVVEVSIGSDPGGTVILTGITIDVVRKEPAPGATFAPVCGDSFTGRAMSVDLDADPPRVVASSSEVDGVLGAEENGRPATRPIEFPWAVSIDDPFLLYIFASTDSSCRCLWTGEITWVSGSRRGVISIDDEGRPYEVVGDRGMPGYSTSLAEAQPHWYR